MDREPQEQVRGGMGERDRWNMLNEGDHVVDYVDDYVHGVLGAGDSSQVARHVERCEICSLALAKARERMEAMRAVPACAASPQLAERTMERVRMAQRRGSKAWRIGWRVALGGLAAVVAILASLHAYFYRLAPSPYDVRLIGQAKLMPDSAAAMRVRLARQDTGKAVGGMAVEMELHDPRGGRVVRLASFTSDAEGWGEPRFSVPDWKDGEYELRVRAKTGWRGEVLSRTVRLERSWKLMLSTDKPVYQPGQTIHLRGLALRRPDLKPLKGEEAVFSLTDPKGNIVFKHRTTTSAYGIVSADCALADEVMEGMYEAKCAVAQTESRASVEVKRYTLPKFKVEVTLEGSYYRPGEVVKGEVKAGYFFGKPVAEGRVQIIARGDDPAWRSSLHQATVRTDAAGKATFQFQLPARMYGREQYSGDARIQVEAVVRDGAGQEERRGVSRMVTNRPLRVTLMPEAGRIVAGVKNVVYVLATYADGRPARATVTIGGLAAPVQTDGLGVGSFEFEGKSGQVDLEVKARDEKGLSASQRVRLDASDGDYVLRTDRAVYQSGGTMRLAVIGGGGEPVFVDLIKDGQTLLSETVELAGGRGERAIDLPAEAFGTLEICAYRLSRESGLPVRKTRTVYVRPAEGLKVEVALDQTEYRPGGKAKLAFSLKDAAGKPTAGALSLAAVDEAVFSVVDAAPGMEKAFFNLEQAMLEPVYTIYPWSPDEGETVAAGRERLEQAIFSRTWREASGGVGEGPYTLVAASYRENKERVESLRRRGLERMVVAWVGLGVVTILALIVWTAWRTRRVGVMLALLATLTLTASVLLPSLSAPRERAAAMRAQVAGRQPAAVEAVTGAAPADWPANVVVSVMPTAAPDAAPVELPRLREWFPETLLWRPEVVTDESGRATIEVDLADSITDWRLTASAVNGAGKLGVAQQPIRVFQPFFVELYLPVALTRGDEVSMPVAVYNYLDKPQTVELALEQEGKWFEGLDSPARRVELKAGEVRSASFRIRAERVGQGVLRIVARGAGVSDAVQRSIEVAADGQRIEQVVNGNLERPARLDLVVPQDAIEGSAKLIVKVYPSSFSQLVEGLDAVFQMPYGCFEQTSSTTYPNVLALDYLRKTKKSAPAVEAKARQYIHLGYQRLVSFEVDGGGFDWFGRAPANRTLTAYGLMEFEDMAAVHEVDPKLLERTRTWLLKQRRADGSWPAERGMLNDGLAASVVRDGAMRELASTAYIGWAVFGGNKAAEQAGATKAFLKSKGAREIEDPYLLAVVANALLGMDSTGESAKPYLDQLVEMRKRSGDGTLAWWEQGKGMRTVFHGAGQSGSVETTALAALALMKAGRDSELVRGSLSWLIQQKDAAGTWRSTQATVLALKALVGGTGRPMGMQTMRQVVAAMGESAAGELAFSPDEGEVMKQMDLTRQLPAGGGELRLEERGGEGSSFQAVLRYHVPGVGAVRGQGPLSIGLTYDRTDLGVGDTIGARATVVNRSGAAAPMVIVDLPIPAGFVLEGAGMDALVKAGTIEKYQVTARGIIVYLRSIKAGATVRLGYTLRARMPVKVMARPARVYEYYDPEKGSASAGGRLTVRAGGGV